MSTLELRNVTKSFGDVVAVDGVDLRVEDNEFYCIFGPPSCGKTTVLRLLLGLASPDSGQILIDGKDVTRLAPGERDLAMVFQNLALFPHLTARENLAFPLREKNASQEAIDATIQSVADKLHIAPLLEKLPAKLSGGERQRVAIGRALMRKPKAYLMDEPIAALDARLREEMRVELKRLQREVGHTLIYVTHDQEEAMSIGDRMAIMQDGRIAQVGSPYEIYNEPISKFVAQVVGSPPMNFIDGTIRAGTFHATDLSLQVVFRADLSDGEVTLGVRPEDVALSAPDDGKKTDCCIFEVEPLGAYSIVDVIIGEKFLKSQLQGQPRFKKGQTVTLSVAAEHCHLFDPHSGANLLRGKHS
jgi:multiple sugar transport system ATP-binding protein